MIYYLFKGIYREGDLVKFKYVGYCIEFNINMFFVWFFIFYLDL